MIYPHILETVRFGLAKHTTFIILIIVEAILLIAVYDIMRYRNKDSSGAYTYDQVSRLVQYRWSRQVIKWRKRHGNEIVMDAGCGSGLLTKQLAELVPRGKVYAVTEKHFKIFRKC